MKIRVAGAQTAGGVITSREEARPGHAQLVALGRIGDGSFKSSGKSLKRSWPGHDGVWFM